jgi:hypothetical protein
MGSELLAVGWAASWSSAHVVLLFIGVVGSSSDLVMRGRVGLSLGVFFELMGCGDYGVGGDV